MDKIKELKEKLAAIKAEADAIQALADQGKRDLTEDEVKAIDGLFKAFDMTEKEITRRERLEVLNSRMEEPGKRVIDNSPLPDPRPGRITGGEPAASRMVGTGGFKSFGEFAMATRQAAGGRVDPRLHVLNAASTTSQEAVGADGGYAVPPDFKTVILQKVMAEDELLAMTDSIPTTSNSVTLPVDETTPWQTSGGIQAYWEGEAAQIPQSKAALRNVTIRANKLTALVNATDELLEDAPSLDAYLRKKAPEKINFKINDAIVNGGGVGMPLGLLNAPALVTQAAEGGQTADTVNVQNITKMWGRLYGKLRKNAVWLINQDVEQQLATLTLGGSSVAFPVYLPPGGFSQAPYATLMGRPVIVTEACQALGDVGDIILTDLTQYLTVVKSGGVKTDMSIHLFFDQGITAFRFIVRIGGNPYWQAAIARKNGSNTLSHAVALAAR